MFFLLLFEAAEEGTHLKYQWNLKKEKGFFQSFICPSFDELHFSPLVQLNPMEPIFQDLHFYSTKQVPKTKIYFVTFVTGVEPTSWYLLWPWYKEKTTRTCAFIYKFMLKNMYFFSQGNHYVQSGRKKKFDKEIYIFLNIIFLTKILSFKAKLWLWQSNAAGEQHRSLFMITGITNYPSLYRAHTFSLLFNLWHAKCNIL